MKPIFDRAQVEDHEAEYTSAMGNEHYLITFIKYNNAVPIILGLLFLGGGGALAATNPAVQQSVYQQTQTVRSIDNTYLASVNLDTFPLQITVTSVSEDDTSYYVSYVMNTINVINYVWKNAQKTGTLTIHKEALKGGDLGLYVEGELAQIRDRELAVLKETQAIERRYGVTQKTVATAYSGIVGKFISPTVETFTGYDPVIDEPPVAESSVPSAHQTLISSESLIDISVIEEREEEEEDDEDPQVSPPEEPPIEEPPPEEPPVEEPPVEEEPVVEPPPEEPAPEEPPAEEPPPEEPPAP